MRLQSSVKNSLVKKALFRGTFISASGVILLLITGSFVPKPLLTTLGLPTLLISSMLIGYGLLPYRKLSRLQLRPHELRCDERHLLFAREGKLLLKIPVSSVEKIEYGEREERYGLRISLKRPPVEKIAILQSGFDINTMVTEAQTHFACDLFLPYFTDTSAKKLNSFFIFS